MNVKTVVASANLGAETLAGLRDAQQTTNLGDHAAGIAMDPESEDGDMRNRLLLE